ncbi:hypothetical protein EON65_34165 [archaeon]|nr:MAG: hypothetical protein EON65_34165 [archaeon]
MSVDIRARCSREKNLNVILTAEDRMERRRRGMVQMKRCESVRKIAHHITKGTQVMEREREDILVERKKRHFHF